MHNDHCEDGDGSNSEAEPDLFAEPAAEAIVELDIEAAPEAVWRALTTDDGFASWIGEGSTIGSAPGEQLRVHDVVTGRARRGYLDEVTPHRRLGYTWWPETEPEQSTRVAISLEPCTVGTRVRVIETRPHKAVAARRPQASASSRLGGYQAGTRNVLPGILEVRVDWLWRVTLLGRAAVLTPPMFRPAMSAAGR